MRVVCLPRACSPRRHLTLAWRYPTRVSQPHPPAQVFQPHAAIHAELSPRNHHILANRALVAAVNKGIIEDNPRRATGEPRARATTPESAHSCWGRRRLKASSGRPRKVARVRRCTPALDIGARKGNLRPEWRKWIGKPILSGWSARSTAPARSRSTAAWATRPHAADCLIHCRCSRRVCPPLCSRAPGAPQPRHHPADLCPLCSPGTNRPNPRGGGVSIDNMRSASSRHFGARTTDWTMKAK